MGANLVRYLVRRGCRPYVILRRSSDIWRIKEIFNKLKPSYADLRDKNSVFKVVSQIRPKIIYHCATYGGYSFQKNYASIMQTNILGTFNLLESCRQVGFDCFVNTGSSSEYGIKNKSMKESDLLAPVTQYGSAKAAATLLCQAATNRYRLPVVTLRLFSPYGYYEDRRRLIPSVIISCLKNRNPALSSSRPVRDFIFIEDVLNAYVKAVQNINKAAGEIFNVAYGRQYRIGEIVSRIIKITSSKVKPRWGNLANPRIEPPTWVADINKTKRLLNWHPRHNLDKGLEKTIDWFRKNIRLYYDKN